MRHCLLLFFVFTLRLKKGFSQVLGEECLHGISDLDVVISFGRNIYIRVYAYRGNQVDVLPTSRGRY